jgi:UDP-2,3-diacylglucosamine hydrolase
MAKHVVFVSDVHLNAQHPAKSERFVGFLKTQQEKRINVLYILGDLFEFWIGPEHVHLSDYQKELRALRDLVKHNTEVNFIYGNRDFMVGPELTKATGIRMLGDHAKIVLNKQKCYLTHGDLFSGRDYGYKSFRRVTRSKLVKNSYQTLPANLKHKIGSGLRSLSTQWVNNKPSTIKDFVPETMRPLFEKGYDVIICGHAHQPKEWKIKTTRGTKSAFVLGDWAKSGSFVDYWESEGVLHLNII